MAECLPGTSNALAALRDAYAASLPAKLDELDALFLALSAGRDTQSLSLPHAGAHKLAGSGGTFGFDAMGNAARRLEHKLKDWMAAGHAPDATDLALLKSLLAELRDLSGRQLVADKADYRQPMSEPADEKTLIGHRRRRHRAGIAAFPDIADAAEMIRAADKALYKAKENGRNRVCHAPLSGPGEIA